MNESMKDWSRRMALRELGHDVSAGSFGIEDLPRQVTAPLIESPALIEPKVAFSRFVELMRRKRGMTVEQLAHACGVEVADIVGIEDEDLTGLGPRTVFQIANCFNVSDVKLMQVAGLMHAQNTSIAEKSLRFAARSNSMASLNKEEREALEQFISDLSGD